MKLLVVLGLIPLISAQQMGFLGFPSMMGFPQGQGKGSGGTQKKYNNNLSMWGFNNMRGKSSGSASKTSNSNNYYYRNSQRRPPRTPRTPR